MKLNEIRQGHRDYSPRFMMFCSVAGIAPEDVGTKMRFHEFTLWTQRRWREFLGEGGELAWFDGNPGKSIHAEFDAWLAKKVESGTANDIEVNR